MFKFVLRSPDNSLYYTSIRKFKTVSGAQKAAYDFLAVRKSIYGKKLGYIVDIVS